MSKPKTCEWCGGSIAADEIRVKLPNVTASWSMTYHAACYCRVYARDCLRAIATDDFPNSVGSHLRAFLDAFDPEKNPE